ncbi:MAG: AAA family ATPase [Rhodobacteraceae bacterium]|nr:AAA family ATPase [Paracoccaceae bacterium]
MRRCSSACGSIRGRRCPPATLRSALAGPRLCVCFRRTGDHPCGRERCRQIDPGRSDRRPCRVRPGRRQPGASRRRASRKRGSARAACARRLAAEGHRRLVLSGRDLSCADRRSGGCRGVSRLLAWRGLPAAFPDRMAGGGLFVIDEPESALSPRHQAMLLRFLAEIQAEADAQVILATHSPILMAVPGARLWRITHRGMSPTDLRATDHFRLLSAFTADPDGFVAAVCAGDIDPPVTRLTVATPLGPDHPDRGGRRHRPARLGRQRLR